MGARGGKRRVEDKEKDIDDGKVYRYERKQNRKRGRVITEQNYTQNKNRV